MRERIESRMDRIEIAMEGLIRSQSQLLTAQVILTEQVDLLQQAQRKTEATLQHFIEENEKAHQRMDESHRRLEESHRHVDEKMAETTEKLNALIHVVDNMIRGKL